MSAFIGNMVVMGNGLSVSTFSGPKGMAVQITPSSGPIDFLQLNLDQLDNLIKLLEAARRGEHHGIL